MEQMIGPNLEVVLSLSEGFDFGFLTSPFIIVASLDGNIIETNFVNPDQNVKFDSDLIWTTNKKNIKKMKNYKVPIRLDFCKTGADRPNFGYVIISLKTAQYVPAGSDVCPKEEKYKVCGLGKEAKGSYPQVQLSLRIQEGSEEVFTERPERPPASVPSLLHMSEPTLSLRIPCDFEENDFDTRTMNVGKETSHQSETPCMTAGDGQQVALAYHCFQLEVNLIDIHWLRDQPPVHFRFHHARADVAWAAHSDVTNASTGDCTDLNNVSAQFRFVESPPQFGMLVAEIPPVVSLCTFRQGRPCVLAKADLLVPTSSQVEVHNTVNMKDLKSHEYVAKLSYSARLSDQGPQTFRQMSCERGEEDIADRIREELDTWKDNEKRNFESECKERLHTEMSLLQSTWEARHRELEEQAEIRTRECKKLAESLQQATADVKEHVRQLSEREEQLEITKNQLESDYRQLVADAKTETARLRDDTLERLKEKDELILKLRSENDKLREELKAERSGMLSRDQVETLLKDTKQLQEKLAKANSSKLFFKEQWGRAVREVHRMKTNGWKDIQVQLEYNRKDLKRLGLEQCLSDSERDQEPVRPLENNDRRLRDLIDQRDRLLRSETEPDDKEIIRLNYIIRELLDA